jgi:hypothetical protein
MENILLLEQVIRFALAVVWRSCPIVESRRSDLPTHWVLQSPAAGLV